MILLEWGDLEEDTIPTLEDNPLLLETHLYRKNFPFLNPIAEDKCPHSPRLTSDLLVL